MTNVVTILADYYFSVDLPDISIPTTASSIELKIEVVLNGGRSGKSILFVSEYYPYNGYVTVRGLREVIESYMLQNNLSAQQFYVYYGEREKAMTVIYSRNRIYGIGAEDFTRNCFLTTQHARLSSASSKEYLYFYEPYPIDFGQNLTLAKTVAVPVVWMLLYRSVSGETCTIEKKGNVAVEYGMNTRSIDMMDLKSIFTNMPSYAVPLMVTIKVGARYFCFYVSPIENQNEFYFRNNFNCYELAVIPSSTTTKTETESSTAICNNEMVEYDVEHKQTYEVQSAQLVKANAQWLVEMLTSPEIRLNNRVAKKLEKMPRILIVDYTSEVTDAPGEENAIKFEWEYASRDMASYMSAEDGGIFTTEYTEPFV